MEGRGFVPAQTGFCPRVLASRSQIASASRPACGSRAAAALLTASLPCSIPGRRGSGSGCHARKAAWIQPDSGLSELGFVD
eukprot:1710536-Rhodomonas_salina.1